ncbi:MAG: penicillin acylase family protein [Candidatus Acidiferrales bacterium]
MTPSHGSHTLRNIAAALLLLLGACCLAAWWMIWRPLPTLDGTVTVPDLSQPVTVDRDRWGVPWIRANSIEDLMVAQGYVVAQDRLWQMDLLRRAAAGELSEIFGKRTLEVDRENRTLGLRVAAEAAASRMDPDTRKILEAYARGVNRYIDERQGRLPIEFTVLRYKPRHWTPTDTFLISAYMWKTLTTTWKAKLNRARITALIGPDRARDLFVVDSPLDHFIVGALPQVEPGAPAAKRSKLAKPPKHPRASRSTSEFSSAGASYAWNSAREILSEFESQTSEIIGSNNFVVNGEHTASGKPILANDTHLELRIPGIWYVVHLTAPGWNVAGFTFPGSPLIIVGHNDRIAWGFTNSNADVEDLYVETPNSSNPREFLANGNWVAAQTRQEVIHVKDEPDDIFEVVLTRHGPIVYRDPPDLGGRAYAVRWTATEPGGLDFSYPLVGSAENWTDFLHVMSKIAGPGQNAVYADVDGNIGYIMAARIPIRKSGNGSLPVDGSTDDAEWTGYIPFDELPQAFNPPGGVIATANARTVGPAYKYFISDRWAGPYRTERMYELLSSQKDMRPADANTVQNDIVSLPDQFLAKQLLDGEQKFQPKDPRTHLLLEKLNGWDARTTADSVETAFVEYTRHALMHNILRPFLGKAFNQYELWEPESQYNDVWWRDKIFLENVLRDRPTVWLPDRYHDYDELLMTSADEAVQLLGWAAKGGSASQVPWGRMHRLEIYHPLGMSGLLKRILSIGPLPQSGTLDTVRATGYRHGPAMRFVADLSDFDQSLMEIPVGESGQYASPYYRDQFPEWFAGRGIPAPFTVAAEERARVHRLTLLPAP